MTILLKNRDVLKTRVSQIILKTSRYIFHFDLSILANDLILRIICLCRLPWKIRIYTVKIRPNFYFIFYSKYYIRKNSGSFFDYVLTILPFPQIRQFWPKSQFSVIIFFFNSAFWRLKMIKFLGQKAKFYNLFWDGVNDTMTLI